MATFCCGTVSVFNATSYTKQDISVGNICPYIVNNNPVEIPIPVPPSIAVGSNGIYIGIPGGCGLYGNLTAIQYNDYGHKRHFPEFNPTAMTIATGSDNRMSKRLYIVNQEYGNVSVFDDDEIRLILVRHEESQICGPWV
jgi:hypothetical protein